MGIGLQEILILLLVIGIGIGLAAVILVILKRAARSGDTELEQRVTALENELRRRDREG